MKKSSTIKDVALDHSSIVVLAQVALMLARGARIALPGVVSIVRLGFAGGEH